MSFSTLTIVVLAGLCGPVLAMRRSWRIPVSVGELVAGLVIGMSGLGLVNASEPTFTLLANIGFGLSMFVVGSHVPLRNTSFTASLRRGMLGAIMVGIGAAILGVALSAAFGTGHPALYGVLIASSSAALILPIVEALRLRGAAITQLTVQVAVADLVCIVALPLAIDPSRALGAAGGMATIAVIAAALFALLKVLDRRGSLNRFHVASERRRFALELRMSLLFLFGLAAVAQFTHISIMLAGFALGLVVGAIGEPRRLARQLFGITEGFFGPLFLVWLGASIGLGGIAEHPWMIALGLSLGLAAVLAHFLARAAGVPWPLTFASAGQLGVPIAAVTLGIQSGLLLPGEDAAILLGAMVTIVASVSGVAIYARRADVIPGPSAS